ncbi:mucin-17 isoform X2 [Cephus cinctus]|nr:mucin-17 isoform X2 [Cephus cinctus]XP_015592144.1 mucin-17 isoform X2 [Cephus cinctus]
MRGCLRGWLSLAALIMFANSKGTFALPVPDDEVDTTTRLLGSSVVTSVSVITGNDRGSAKGHHSSDFEKTKAIPGKFSEMPASPAVLLRPDRFQFYTLNKNGDVVTKQMTEQEIHSLIAAGGGQLPVEMHEPQKVGDEPSGGMKVADVVQNVQNVLKSELSKPMAVMTSVPTIPGHANAEWSSILPSILAGDVDSASLGTPELVMIPEMKPEPVKNVSETTEQDTPTESMQQLVPITTKEPVQAPEISETKPEQVPSASNDDTPTKEASHEPGTVVPVTTEVSQNPPEAAGTPLKQDTKPETISTTETIIPSKQDQETVTNLLGTPEPVKLQDEPETNKSVLAVSETSMTTEKPMIQVPVITMDIKPQTPETDMGEMPVFQMLNTISADTKNQSLDIVQEDDTKTVTELPGMVQQVVDTEKNTATLKPEIPEASGTAEGSEDILQVTEVMHAVPLIPVENSEILKEQPSVPNTASPEVLGGASVSTTIPEIVDDQQKIVSTSWTEPETVPLEITSSPNEIDMPHTVSVISETQSTSIKVEGLQENPAADLKPGEKPEIESSDTIQIDIKEKPEVPVVQNYSEGSVFTETKNLTVSSNVEDEMEKVTPTKETNVTAESVNPQTEISTPTEDEKPETSTLPGLFVQGVSLIENLLPESVSSIVTELISNKQPEATSTQEQKPSQTSAHTSEIPTVSDTGLSSSEVAADTMNSSISVKNPEPTDISTPQVAPVTVPETSTKQEEVLEKVQDTQFEAEIRKPEVQPETKPNVEKVISTLTNPEQSGTSEMNTGVVDQVPGSSSQETKPEASTADNKNSNGSADSSDLKLSTTATFMDAEKPVDSLSTELADSLSSMMSQISDAAPSVMTLSESTSTEPAEVVQSEPAVTVVEHGKVPAIKPDQETKFSEETEQTEIPESSVMTPNVSSVQLDTPAAVNASDIKSEITATNEVSAPASTEKVEELIKTEKPEIPINRIDLPDKNLYESTISEAINDAPVVDNKPEPSETETKVAMAEVVTDPARTETPKIPETQSNVEPSTKDSTQKTEISSEAPEITESMTPEIAPGNVSENIMIEMPVLQKEQTTGSPDENTEKVIDNTPSKQDTALIEDSQSSVTGTETPITRIDITDAKPEISSIVLTTPEDAEKSTESPVVRIQLTDAVSVINQMLETVPTQTSTSSLELLTLPENSKVSAGSIASGLIAGFPAGTTEVVSAAPEMVSASLISGISENSEETPSKDMSVKLEISKPETEENVKISMHPISTENIGTETNSESGPEKTVSTTEKIQDNTEQILDSHLNTVEVENESLEVKEKDQPQNPTERMPVESATEVPFVRIDLPVSGEKISMVADSEADVKTPANTETSKPAISTDKLVPAVTTEFLMTETGTESQNDSNTESATISEIPLTTISDAKGKPSFIKLESQDTKSETSETLVENVSETTSSMPEKILEETLITVQNDTVKSPESSTNTSSSASVAESTTATQDSATIKYEDSSTTNSEESEKTIKPETPIVRIDISPETSHIEIPQKIQLTDLPIVSTFVETKKPDQVPETTEQLKLTESMESPLTTVIPVKSPSESSTNVVAEEKPVENEKLSSGLDALKSQTNSNGATEISSKTSTAGINENDTTQKSDIKSDVISEDKQEMIRIEQITQPEKTKLEADTLNNSESPTTSTVPVTLTELLQPPKPIASLSQADTQSSNKSDNKKTEFVEIVPQKTQEIRIQVNDTAVLVTKHPISDETPQKLAETINQKPPTVQEGLKKTPEPEVVFTTKPETVYNKVETIPETSVNVAQTDKTALKPEENDRNVSQIMDSYMKLGEKEESKPSEVKNPETGDNVVPDVSGASKLKLNEEKTDKPVINNKDETKTNVEASLVSKDEGHYEKLGEKKKPVVTAVNSKPIVTDLKKEPTKEAAISASMTDEPQVSMNKEEYPYSKLGETIKTTKPLQSSQNIQAGTPALPTEQKRPSFTTPSNIKNSNSPIKGEDKQKPSLSIKKADHEGVSSSEEKWTLIPQQVPGSSVKTTNAPLKKPMKTSETGTTGSTSENNVEPADTIALEASQSASGLESSVKNLDHDMQYFARLCNELAFSFWTATNKGLSTARSLALSPFGMTSILAMVFLGARGPTSNQMNDVLKLDDVATFNPHLVFQNVTDTVSLARNQGIANAAFVRVLFADRNKVGRLMPFYKEQAQQFYEGFVAEVNFATISDLVRRRTNFLIRKQTGGRIKDFVKGNTVPLRSPLAALSANVFQTDCNSSGATSEGRDGELYFAVSPAIRQRKLVPVPATTWRSGVLAGYEPGLDATAIAMGGVDKLVSTIFVIPGQQGHAAPGDSLDRLEQRLVEGAFTQGAWEKLLKVLVPRPGLELQVPKFSHRSVVNATAALKRMGLEELFSNHADLKGINSARHNFHLADMLQINLFSTCGEENIITGRHHVEVYPASPLRNVRGRLDLSEEVDNYENIDASTPPQDFEEPEESHRTARQANASDKPRLKLDRPFLYFVRHNPTGLILHMGRFNPRLLP